MKKHDTMSTKRERPVTKRRTRPAGLRHRKKMGPKDRR